MRQIDSCGGGTQGLCHPDGLGGSVPGKGGLQVRGEALVCSSLGPISLGLSGLPGSLFPLPDWGSFPSLFVQICFQFALPFSFWHPYDSDVRVPNVVPEVPKPLLIF